jgi:hypothetical protein
MGIDLGKGISSLIVLDKLGGVMGAEASLARSTA